MLSYGKAFLFIIAIIIIAWVAGAILNSQKQKISDIKNIMTKGVNSNNSAYKPIVGNDCVPAGCSKELCVDENTAKDVVSICLYKDVYSCYKKAVCERQNNDKCGWSETKELIDCVGKFK